MVFQPGPPGSCQIRLTHMMDGAMAQNVLYWRNVTETPLSQPQLELVVEQFIHAWQFGLTEGPRGMLSSSVHLTKIEVIGLDQETSPAATRDIDLPGLQTDGNACPPQVAVCVATTTAFRGRNWRGRVFVMGIPEDDVASNGDLLPTPLAAWKDRWANFLAAMDDGDSIQGFWMHASKMDDGVLRPEILMEEVTAIDVRPRVKTQRRRLQTS